MKNILFGLLCLTLIWVSGCKPNSPPPAPTNSILQGMVKGGCAMETAISNQAGAAVCSTTGCPSASACEGYLAGNWGALNLCAIPIPAAAQAALAKAAGLETKDVAQWHTIGDIPGAALGKPGQVKSALQSLGIIGTVVCPLADGLLLGAFTAQIPPLCQGPNSLSATAANAAFSAACLAVTTPLP